MTVQKGRAVDSLGSPGTYREGPLGHGGLVRHLLTGSEGRCTQTGLIPGALRGAFSLLTSACAVMLEFITVHSLFAVSSFPADRRGAFLAGSHPGLVP